LLRHLTIVMGFALAACSATDPNSHPRVCGSDGDCPSGLECSFEFCTVDAPTTLPLGARITPPGALELLVQQLPALAPDPLVGNTITLRRPVVVVGTVRNEGDAFSLNLPGELEARTAGDIPGLDYRFTARSLDGLDDAGHGFTLRLLEGRDYVVTFRPESRDTPPYTFTLPAEQVARGQCDSHSPSDGGPVVQHDVCRDVLLPKRSDYVRFQRFVRLGSVDLTPVGGARVNVELPDGRALPEVLTDEAKGSFDVNLPPGTDSVRLRISAADDGPLFPDFQSEWLDTDPADGVTAVVIDALPPNLVQFEAALSVRAPGDGGSLAPVTGVSLTMFGHLEGGTLRRSAVTDADGVARFSALPGAYEIIVNVPPGLGYAARRVKLTLDAPSALGDEPVPIVLDSRLALEGTVRDAANRPVTAGSFIATRRPDKDANEALVLATAAFQGALDASGRFALLVDPGIYDVRVLPEPFTGAPAYRLAGVVVDGPTELPLPLPAPSLAHLQVVDPDGAPIHNAIVELFTPATPDDLGNVPNLVAKGTTEGGGTVDLIVPFAP
jgi:hypothetical protein